MKKQTFIYSVSVIVLMLFMIVYFGLRGGYFLQNDDIVMRNIVSGVYTGKPDAHAFFITYPLSFLIKILYTVLPNVPWYGAIMVFLNHFAILLILLRVGMLFERLLEKYIAGMLAFAVIFLIDFDFIVSNEFTVTSGILAAAAVFLIATAKKNSWIEEILILGLLLFSMWYRFSVFEMSIPFVLVAMALRIYKAYNAKEIRHAVVRTIVEILALFLLAVGSKAVHNKAYSSEEWQEYKSFNSARAAVFDYDALQPYEDYIAYNPEKTISKGDYIGLQNMKYAFLENLSIDELKEVSKLNNYLKEQWKQFYHSSSKLILDTTEALLNSFKSFGGIITLMVFIVVFSVGMCFRKYEVVLTSVVSYGGMVLLLGWCVYRERVLDRVFVPTYLMAIFLMVASLADVFGKIKKISLLLVINCLLVCLIIGSFGIYKRRDSREFYYGLVYENSQWAAVNGKISANPETIFLVDTDLMPQHASASNEKSVCSDNHFFITSWLWGSPVWEQHKNRFGIENIRESFLEDDNVCLLASKNSRVDWIEELFPGVQFEQIIDETIGTTEYRIKR